MELIAQWFILWSFLIGFLGSLGYYTAVYFNFITPGPEGRDYILGFFRDRYSALMYVKVGWFCAIGGLVAGTFQLPQSEFVPIQSFVLGATWPSIVGQLLSGRQAGLSREELGRLGLTRDAASASERETRAASVEASQVAEELAGMGITIDQAQREAEEATGTVEEQGEGEEDRRGEPS